jgi:hypothetical protein
VACRIARYLAYLSGVGGLGSISSGPGQAAQPGVNPWLTGGSIAAQLGSSYLGSGGTFGF